MRPSRSRARARRARSPTGCRRLPAPPAAAAAHVPKGDVLWFVDPAGGDGPDARRARSRSSARWPCCLPGGTAPGRGGARRLRRGSAPAASLRARRRSSWSSRPDEALAASLSGGEGPEAEGLAAAAAAPLLSREISAGGLRPCRRRPPRLSVLGPLRGALRRVRREAASRDSRGHLRVDLDPVPAGRVPTRARRSRRSSSAADALVAFVFGSGTPCRHDRRSTPCARPWWAALRHARRRRDRKVRRDGRRGRPGAPRRLAVGEPALRVRERPFGQRRERVRVHAHRPRAGRNRRACRSRRATASCSGCRRSPRCSSSSAPNLAGKRNALGRAVLFGGATEGERVFAVAALEDVLLGRALAPVLEVARPAGRPQRGHGRALNRTHHASVASRVDNWVEVDLAPAHPGRRPGRAGSTATRSTTAAAVRSRPAARRASGSSRR